MRRPTVAERIYETFFAELAEREIVGQGTIADLHRLCDAGELGSERKLASIVQRMEKRHAKDKETDG